MRIHLPVPRIPTFGPTHIVVAVAVLLLALFAYSAVQTATHTVGLRETQRRLEIDVAGLRLQRAELEGLRTYLASDEYIEGVARARFGLVLPGEIEVVVSAPAGPEREPEPGERWWEALFGR